MAVTLGGKKRRHEINSVPPSIENFPTASVTVVEPIVADICLDQLQIFDPVVYLQELINENFQVQIINFLNLKKLFQVKMVQSSIQEVSDQFIEKTFEIQKLKVYFEESAWGVVLDRVSNDRLKSTCKICFEVCLQKSICCSKCEIWYHWKCAKVLAYHRSGTSKNWHCCKCKGDKKKLKKINVIYYK
jgi:hypothetical protein